MDKDLIPLSFALFASAIVLFLSIDFPSVMTNSKSGTSGLSPLLGLNI